MIIKTQNTRTIKLPSINFPTFAGRCIVPFAPRSTNVPYGTSPGHQSPGREFLEPFITRLSRVECLEVICRRITDVFQHLGQKSAPRTYRVGSLLNRGVQNFPSRTTLMTRGSSRRQTAVSCASASIIWRPCPCYWPNCPLLPFSMTGPTTSQ